jgi:hypothetical protein
MESRKTHANPFNMFTNAQYHYFKVVGDDMRLQASTTSLDKSIKKSDNLCVEKE